MLKRAPIVQVVRDRNQCPGTITGFESKSWGICFYKRRSGLEEEDENSESGRLAWVAE